MEIADKQHTSSKPMQEFHANLTSQTNSLTVSLSLTQSFNHGENITKQLFCFQLACQKSQTRAKVALFCQQQQYEFSLSGKVLPPTNFMFFIIL